MQARSSRAMSPTSSNSCPKSDDFPKATQAEVKQLSDDICWACETRGTDVYHVIAKEDKQVRVTMAAVSKRRVITIATTTSIDIMILDSSLYPSTCSTS